MFAVYDMVSLKMSPGLYFQKACRTENKCNYMYWPVRDMTDDRSHKRS